jgi:outer membrane protein assembly factor BamB
MRRRTLILLLGMGLLDALSPYPAVADGESAGWPVFRGNPLQTGVAASALADTLDIVWKIKTKDSIEGTAAIAGNTVYVGSMDEHLYALDLATGKVKWSYKMGPVKAAVAVAGDAVYVGNADGIFHCVDAATGQKRWTYETGAEIGAGANFTNDAVLFGSGDETLYCLTRAGKERWKFKVPGGPVLGTPVVVGGRTFAAGCDSTLHVIDTATGKELGAVDLGGQVGATAAVVGDELYLGTMANQLLAVNWKKQEVVWKFEARRPQAFYASAGATATLVIGGSRDRHVYGLERTTGKEIWNFATRNRVDSSPVVAGQRVYAASMDGNLYVLDLEKGAEIKRFELGSAITASPAVSGGRLVIGTTDGTVYCLGAKNGTGK